MWNKLNIKQKHVDSLETQVIQLKAIQPDRAEADQAKDIIVQEHLPKKQKTTEDFVEDNAETIHQLAVETWYKRSTQTGWWG